ncbi:hypothetical protein [Zooshikella sp. RANM57]|uniref:hypothetical protein n=1 Tax=Zooshikella sp. RANM57 TaxID=3425863 RepID=UPI003D6DD977
MEENTNAYKPPNLDIEPNKPENNKGWIFLAIWTIALIIINITLSFILSIGQLDGKSIGLVIGFVFGNVLGLPIIILALSQIWRKHRNVRSRIKAILYPSYLVLFSQVSSFFSLVSEVANK